MNKSFDICEPTAIDRRMWAVTRRSIPGVIEDQRELVRLMHGPTCDFDFERAMELLTKIEAAKRAH